MKNFFINSKYIKILTETNNNIPEIIKIAQYNQNINNNNAKIIEGYYIDNNNQYVYNSAGNLGNGNFEFLIDARHNGINAEDETENFKWINTILNTRKFPMFSRSELFNRFIILEIPDYGVQSMSPFFKDYKTWIFYNGKKLWQRYVGILKHYTNKKTYLLIDKNESNLNEKITDVQKLLIRIVLKEDLEVSYENLINYISNNLTSNKIIPVRQISQNGTSLDKQKKENYIFYKSDILFALTGIDGSFTLPDLNDYYYFIKVNNEIKLIPEHFIKEVNLIKQESTYDIASQTNLNEKYSLTTNQKTNITNDYFKQAYIRNYLLDSVVMNADNTIIDSNNIVMLNNNYSKSESYFTLQLLLKEQPFINSNIETIYITSKHLLYSDAYIKNENELKSKFGCNFSINNSAFYFFNKDGYKVNSIQFDGSAEYEVVPEFKNNRKLEFVFSNNSNITLNNLLYSLFGMNTINSNAPYFRWNIETPETLIFKENSEKHLIPYILNNELAAGVYDISIFDDAEPELSETELSKLTATTVSEPVFFNFNSKPNKTNYITPTNYIDVIFKNSDTVDILNEKIPLSFYLSVEEENSGDILKSLIIARNFPVLYETYKINNYLYYFKLPNFYFKDISVKEYAWLKKEEENKTINKNGLSIYKLNKQFLHSVDKWLLFTNNKNKISLNCKIFNIEHLNRISEKRDEYNLHLGTDNIINYKNNNVL